MQFSLFRDLTNLNCFNFCFAEEIESFTFQSANFGKIIFSFIEYFQ